MLQHFMHPTCFLTVFYQSLGVYSKIVFEYRVIQLLAPISDNVQHTKLTSIKITLLINRLVPICHSYLITESLKAPDIK